MSAPMEGPGRAGVGANTRAEVVLINGPSRQSIALARVMALFSNTASPTTRGRVFLGDRGYGENRLQARLTGPGPNGAPTGGAIRPIARPAEVIGSPFPAYPNPGYDVDGSVGLLGLDRLTDLGWR